VSERLAYPVPWDLVFGLTKHFADGTQRDIDGFTREIVSRMDPPPRVEGWEHLPEDPRFVLVPNHYQRPGLWILHCAAAMTQAVRERYGPGDPPVRWVVTANWPPIRLGPWKLGSPGDWLLPKVAHVLHCYPVSFAGNNPAFSAASIRRILKEAKRVDRPIGIFPEGVAGTAGVLVDPLPGVDRVLRHLGTLGWPAVPCGVSEAGRFVLRFGPVVPALDLAESEDAAKLCMAAVAALL
jgi:hypothetical protein